MKRSHPSKNLPHFLRLSFLTLLLLAATTLPGRTQAAVETYSDMTSFLDAAGTLTTVTFTGDAPDGGYTSLGTSFMESGVTFQAGSGDTLNTTSSTYLTGYDYGTGVVLGTLGSAPRILTIELPAGTTAFGINFGAFTALPTTFTLSTGDSFVRESGTPTGTGGSGLAFIGFTSSDVLSSVQVEVEVSGDGNVVDNVAFGTVPEPSTWALLVVGAGGAGIVTLRRRQAHA